MRASSRALVGIMKDYFIDEMSTIIDEEKKITHVQLSQKIEAKIDDDKFFRAKEMKLGPDVRSILLLLFIAYKADFCHSLTHYNLTGPSGHWYRVEEGMICGQVLHRTIASSMVG